MDTRRAFLQRGMMQGARSRGRKEIGFKSVYENCRFISGFFLILKEQLKFKEFDKIIKMKQYTITIPDEEESGFIELMKGISYITNIEKNSIFDIPEEHKQLVRERIEKYKNNPESYMTWVDIENKMKLD